MIAIEELIISELADKFVQKSNNNVSHFHIAAIHEDYHQLHTDIF